MRHQRNRHLAISFAVFAICSVIAILIPEQRTTLFNLFLAFAVLTLSLDLLIGGLNMLAGSHAAFFGAGAYLAVLFHEEWGWSYALGAVVAVVATAALAILVGLPATARTTGMHFAIVTFAFGELLVQIVENAGGLTGGTEGRSVAWGAGEDMPFDWSIYRYFSVWLSVALLITLVVLSIMRNSHFGLRMRAIKENENFVRGLGFNPVWYKTVAFVVGSSLAALAGTMYAPMSGFLNPSLMSAEQSILMLGLLIVGGMNRLAGPFLGVGLLYILPEYLNLDPTTRTALVGGTMGLVILFEPQGLAGIIARSLSRRRSGAREKGASPPPAATESTLEGHVPTLGSVTRETMS